jgi:nucleotide-binding universal stress UspA family protein
MFKNILVPTDGSELSQKAVTKAIQFAKEIGATIYGFHVRPDFTMPVHGVDVYEPHRFHEMTEKEARAFLAQIADQAKAAGVRCETAHEIDSSPYRAIIKAAEKNNCDLIFMASHGRRGLSGLLLGSETQKVLTHSKIPVLVYREG